MALVNFKKGELAKLPQEHVEGTFYVTTDERAIYLDVDSNTRIRIGDFQEVADVEALNKLTNKSESALYYVKSINCLAKYDATKQKFVQINLDTGATSVEVVGGDANGVSIAYDSATRKITLTMSKTFVTGTEVDAKIDAKVGDLGSSYSTVKAYVDAKTEGIASDAELTELQNRVGAVEELVGEDSVESQISDAIDGLSDVYQTKEQAAADKQELEGAIDEKADQDEVDGHETRIQTLEGKIGGLSGAMHFKGTATSDPAKMDDFSDYETGDVVVWQQKEFVFDGEAFVELGDVTAETKRISDLEARVQDLDDGLSDVEVKLDGIEDTVTDYVDEKTGGLETRVGVIEGKESGWDDAATQASANKEAIAAIKDGETIDSFADVEDALDEKQDKIEDNTYDDYGAAADAEKNAKAYTDTALTWGSF